MVLCAVMLMCTVSFPVFAAENVSNQMKLVSSDVVYFEDGTSFVFEVYEYSVSGAKNARATETKVGIGRGYVRDALGNNLYRFNVHGTFAITDAFVRATASTYSHDIYASLYSLRSANTNYYDNYATGSGRFYDSLGNLHRTINVTVSCDLNGTISSYYTLS